VTFFFSLSLYVDTLTLMTIASQFLEELPNQSTSF